MEADIVDLVILRARFDRKLCAQWDWFAANPDHPETEAKNDVFVRTLRRYEAICDEIAAARGTACPSR